MDNLIFEPLNFVKNLGYMGKGMIGIFVVIGLIVATTMILNHATSSSKKKKKSKD